jgi:putative phosphoesterase
MKLGLISDVHGDPVALELAWSYLTVMGADRIVCAGDLVGYGPFPDGVVSFVQGRGIASVRGNHDRWALERGENAADEFGGGSPSSETIDYLGTLGFHLELAADPVVAVVVHGSPRSDLEFVNRLSHPPEVLRRYLRELGCDLLVVGHTHRPMWFRSPERLVVNPGSVISIAGVDSSRTFAMVDTDTLTPTFHDVESGDVVEVRVWD